MTQNVGKLFVVVGPSGVGKDSLIDYAKQRLKDNPTILFVQRTITRPANTGGEDHVPVSVEQFYTERQHGAFAVFWEAHGLHYGIPANVQDWIAAGKSAIVNGSRHALPLFAQTFADITIVSVTARPEVVAERLHMRGRETGEEIAKRLARSEMDFRAVGNVVTIENSGTLESAGEILISILMNPSGGPTLAPEERAKTETALGRFMNNAAMCL